MQYGLKFLIEEIDDSIPECLEIHSGFLEFLYNLTKNCSNAEKTYVSLALTIGKTLNLGVVYFFHLVSLLFSISFEDSLTSVLSCIANCFFVEYPLASYKSARNLLILAKVYIEQWLLQKYSSEITRCLQRVIKKYKSDEVFENLEPAALFLSESDSLIYSYALQIYNQQKKLFEGFIAYKNIFGIGTQPEEAKPMKFYYKPIEEVTTFEPLIFDKIKSSKKNKDLNKEITELDKLREQAKRGRKLAKKALEKETEISQHDKSLEYQLLQQKKESNQNYVRNMLDELQVEYKKFDTTLEKRQEKKKRKKRMAGNKTEHNK